MSAAGKTALLVGLGGLGCPAALCLALAPLSRLVLVDDDVVSLENLHRQILFEEADVGRPKAECAAKRLATAGCEIVVRRERFVPENAEKLLQGVDVLVEGADNFATKFLACDAARLCGLPVVHGAAIRWHGTALLSTPSARPCYRCLFEDLLPDELAPGCDTAGVVGPAVGLVGALMADLALDALGGTFARAGRIFSIDAKRGRLRETPIFPRRDCKTCGESARLEAPLTRTRYVAPLHL